MALVAPFRAEPPTVHARHFLSCISADEVITGLRYFRQQIGRPLVLVWGRLAADRSRRVRDFLARHQADYRVEWLPGYAPELNPEEQCNNCVKLALLNVVPETVEDLRALASRHFKRLARKPHLLYHFFQHTGLSVT